MKGEGEEITEENSQEFNHTNMYIVMPSSETGVSGGGQVWGVEMWFEFQTLGVKLILK